MRVKRLLSVLQSAATITGMQIGRWPQWVLVWAMAMNLACGPKDPPADDSTPEPESQEEVEPFALLLSELEDSSSYLVVRESTPHADYERYRIWFSQPLCHGVCPEETRRFWQQAVVHLRDPAAPVVFTVTGYALWPEVEDELTEPTMLLGANQVHLEHRHFGLSVPELRDGDDPSIWQYLTTETAANDFHAVIEALRPHFEGPWLGTGISKGGTTMLYQEYYHPDDFDAVLAYVAPLSFGLEDSRYPEFLGSLQAESCFAAVRELQAHVLNNFSDYSVSLYDLHEPEVTLSDAESALINSALNLEWVFWQYRGAPECAAITEIDVDDTQAMLLLLELAYTEDFDSTLAAPIEFYQFGPYIYQVLNEIGYPADDFSHFDDAIADLASSNIQSSLFDPTDANASLGTPWESLPPVFDELAMGEVDTYLRGEAENIMLVYGEYDPWTAGEATLFDAPHNHVVMVPQASHWATLAGLPETERSQAVDDLEAMLGLSSANTHALRRWAGRAVARSSPAPHRPRASCNPGSLGPQALRRPVP